VFAARGAPQLCRAAHDRELSARLEPWVSDARRADAVFAALGGLLHKFDAERVARCAGPVVEIHRLIQPRASG
jgi:hypothetical protein